jgi:ribulose-5-phosphate 4-epimerase/fuculose-1-phosphate aldolase
MNKPADIRSTVSAEEWNERVNLAACYRLLALYGWDDVIYNHASVRVPGEDRKFLMKRHTLLYTEVTASNLVKVDMDADLDESAGVNRPGFTLHGGVLQARPDVNSAIHVHTEMGQSISAVADGLLMISQSAMRFYKRVGYHPYEGLTDAFDERPRIAANLAKNRALILENHGVLTVGKTVRESFVLLKYLLEAARIQLTLQASGAKLREIPPHICEKTAAQYEKHDAGRGADDWPAYLRRLDTIDPSYAH